MDSWDEATARTRIPGSAGGAGRWHRGGAEVVVALEAESTPKYQKPLRVFVPACLVRFRYRPPGQPNLHFAPIPPMILALCNGFSMVP